MKSTRNNAPEGFQVFFTRIKRVGALLWIMGACIVLLSGFRSPLWAQDLAVDWVTVTPSEGEAGDAASLQA
jgi:hypothetical protein